MNFQAIEARDSQNYLIFEQGGQKFVCDSAVADSANEFGIDAQAIKNTLRTNKYFAGIQNSKLTETQAREVLEAAMVMVKAQPELVN